LNKGRGMSMKWILRRFILIAFIGFLALNIAMTTKAFFSKNQSIQIITPNEQISNSKYIISEEMIMSKLKSKSQIVSLEQDLHKKDTHVDDGLLGERHTELTVNGTYKMGLNTKDIEIKHIDSQNGIVYIKLGKPVLISLDIPYDQVEFDKKQGFFRLAMDEKEQKNFYKSVDKNIERELIKDKEIMKVADSMNRDVIVDLLNGLPEIKNVVFE
jgi:hypothetical protein